MRHMTPSRPAADDSDSGLIANQKHPVYRCGEAPHPSINRRVDPTSPPKRPASRNAILEGISSSPHARSAVPQSPSQREWRLLPLAFRWVSSAAPPFPSGLVTRRAPRCHPGTSLTPLPRSQSCRAVARRRAVLRAPPPTTTRRWLRQLSKAMWTSRGIPGRPRDIAAPRSAASPS